MVQSFCSCRSRSQKRTGVFSGNKKLHFVEQTVVFCEGGLTTNRFGQASLCRLFLVSIASSSKKNTCVLLQSLCWLVKSSQIACFVVTRCYKLQAYGSEMPMDHQAWTPWRRGSFFWFASGIAKVWISPAKLGISSTIRWYGGETHWESECDHTLNIVQLDLSCGSKMFQTCLTFATLRGISKGIIGDIGTAIVFSAPSRYTGGIQYVLCLEGWHEDMLICMQCLWTCIWF